MVKYLTAQNVTPMTSERSIAAKHRQIIIKQHLLLCGLRPSAIATRLHCSRAMISQVVAGTRRSRRIEARIAQLIGIPRRDLWP